MPSSIQNELIYIIRLTPEGETEVVKATRVLDQTGKKVEQVDKRVGKYKNTLIDTSRKTARFSKDSSVASNALLDLSRIAQDAPFGIRGIANNLEQAAVTSGRAIKQFGGVTGALRGMVGVLTGPIGIVVGVTAFTAVMNLAERGLFSFGAETKDFSGHAEKLVGILDRVNDELAELKGLGEGPDIFNLEAVTQGLIRANLLEESIKDRIRGLKDEAAFRGTIAEAFGATPEQLMTDEQREDLMRWEAYLDRTGKRRKELEMERQAIIDAQSLPELQAAQAEKALEEYKNLVEKARKELNETVEPPEDVILPVLITDEQLDAGFNKLLKRNEEFGKQQEQFLERRVREQEKFEQELAQMRISVARSNNDQLLALRLEEQHKIEQISNNELLTARQKEEAITLLEQNYSNIRVQIAQQEEQRKRAAVLATIAMFSGQLQASFQDSKAVAIATGTANAILSGINVAKTVAGFAPPPIPALAGAAMAALQLSQVARIESISLGSGSGGAASIGFRGFDNTVPNPSAGLGNFAGRPSLSRNREREKTFPMVVRLEDKAGNFLTKLQFAQDKAGGRPYLVDRED